jgi:CheY-like chemotaxis protein
MADAPSKTPIRVLVVDDESGLRHMLQFGLTKRGYEVVEAASGEQALELAREGRFDIVVTDIMMPGIDGLEVLRQLKAISPKIEVIMATGYATLENAIEAMKLGAFDYVTKPYSLSHLCTIFEKAIERRSLKARVAHLEEIDRLKSEFVATMSHELRTPLASAMGYVALLGRGIYGPTNENQEKALGRIEANLGNLLQLINSVLDFSKLTANRMTLALEDFHLDELVADVVRSLEALASQKGLALSMKCPAQISVKADRTRVRQILVNLAGNAIKFTKAGSVALEVLCPEDPSQVNIRVVDTGIGIEEKHIPLLFQDFHQIDGSTTREHPGTGLGLSISKKLIDLMGGTITVESKPGSGSVFSLRLPIRTAALSKPEVPLVSALSAGERVILAIDDDLDMLHLLEQQLAETQFRLVGVRSGKEGLVLARTLRPEGILLDLMMPEMDGWTVLRELKKDPLLRTIPVHVVSMVDNQARAFELGASGYIQKPFSRDDLLKELAQVSGKVRQVMVVDDSPDVREQMRSALTSEGYDVVTIATGEEALEQLSTLSPDAMFLDLTLPGISGFDVLQQLDSRQSATPITIIVMTARELTEDQRDYLRRRVSVVLSKGTFSLSEALNLLKTKLDKGKVA